MSKGILEFDLYEDREAFEVAQNGSAYLGILQEFDNYLRGRLKYEDLPEAVDKALQDARDKLHEISEDTPIWK